MSPHEFGGDWTSDKLERIRKYLSAYTIIFNRNEQARKLFPIYVDAFAGTGYRTPSQSSNKFALPLLELSEPDNISKGNKYGDPNKNRMDGNDLESSDRML